MLGEGKYGRITPSVVLAIRPMMTITGFQLSGITVVTVPSVDGSAAATVSTTDTTNPRSTAVRGFFVLAVTLARFTGKTRR